MYRLWPSDEYVPGLSGICCTKSSYFLFCPLVALMETLVPTGGDIVMLPTGGDILMLRICGDIVMLGICAGTGWAWVIWCCAGDRKYAGCTAIGCGAPQSPPACCAGTWTDGMLYSGQAFGRLSTGAGCGLVAHWCWDHLCIGRCGHYGPVIRPVPLLVSPKALTQL
jgi:hypothetical protein